MGIYLIVALRNLLQARRRSLFLSLALAMVSALLVLLLALSQGLTDNMLKSATTLASGHVNVGGFFKLSPGDVAPFVIESPKLKAIVAETVPEAAAVIDRHHGWSRIVSDTGSIWTSLSGIDPSQEKNLLETLLLAPKSDYQKDGGPEVEGDVSKAGQDGNILLFASQAKRLGVHVGDSVTVFAESTRGAHNSADYTVVAVARDMGMISQFTAFVPKQSVRELYQLGQDTTGAVMIYLREVGQAEAVMARLRERITAEGYGVLEHKSAPFFQKIEDLKNEDWTGFQVDLTTWEDETSFLKWIVTGFDTVSFFLIGVLLLIIVIGIMNTMWMSVRERTGEVGTLRAIGMGRGRVLMLFLTEALLLGFFASTVGGIGGALLAAGIDAAAFNVPSDAARMILLSDTVHLSVNPSQVARAIVMFTVVTGFSALWPAFRAARMRPVTAIHHVG